MTDIQAAKRGFFDPAGGFGDGVLSHDLAVRATLLV